VLLQLLDDNRELYIPETQQVIKAKDTFILFATQNPPGHYGGRKVCVLQFYTVIIMWQDDCICLATLPMPTQPTRD